MPIPLRPTDPAPLERPHPSRPGAGPRGAAPPPSMSDLAQDGSPRGARTAPAGPARAS